jgi:hypothetical protein
MKTDVGPFAHQHNCTKTLVQRTKKIRMQDILNLLHRKTTKVVIQKIILHKKLHQN